MANPQIEKGNFTQISNEIWERLMQCSLNNTELRTAMFVLRLTYGFKRKEAQISSAELCEHLEIDSSNARKVLGGLCNRGIITKTAPHKGVIPPTYRFNKDWEKWSTGRRTPLPELLASRVSRYPTKEPLVGCDAPDKQAPDTRLTGTRHPTNRHRVHDYVSKDANQNDSATRGIKNKEQRINNPPTPTKNPTPEGELSGGVVLKNSDPAKKPSLRERVREQITRCYGLKPKPKEMARTEDLFRTPVPPGWDAQSWRRHVQAVFYEALAAVVAENTSGKFSAPTSIACARTEARLPIDAKTPRKEAI